MNRYLYLICIVALAVSLSSSLSAESYQFYSRLCPLAWESQTYTAWFDIEDNVFSMHGTHLYQNAHTGQSTTLPWNPTVDFYGTWGTFGTINNGILTPDPYAQFVIDGPGSGHIVWAAGTPQGYVAPLQVGMIFNGCGAATIPQPNEMYYLATVNITQPNPYNEDLYYNWQIKFDETYYVQSPVPEPLSITAFITGLLGLPLLRRRR